MLRHVRFFSITLLDVSLSMISSSCYIHAVAYICKGFIINAVWYSFVNTHHIFLSHSPVVEQVWIVSIVWPLEIMLTFTSPCKVEYKWWEWASLPCSWSLLLVFKNYFSVRGRQTRLLLNSSIRCYSRLNLCVQVPWFNTLSYIHVFLSQIVERKLIIFLPLNILSMGNS